MKEGFYWVVSYPKSGNTWTRAIIVNYRNDQNVPCDINQLNTDKIAAASSIFEFYSTLSFSELTHEEIEHYRPKVYQLELQDAQRDLYVKVHDAYTKNSSGVPLFPEALTKGVVYLVRNPLDVAVSYSHYSAGSIANQCYEINNESRVLAPVGKSIKIQLPQRLLSWSSHIKSWLDSGLPIHIARYEDMIANPFETFYGILEFLGFEMDEQRLSRAIEFSSFKALKQQESEKGFIEKLVEESTFFRKGEIGSYRNELSDKQIQQIVEYNREAMQQFGYLDKEGNLLI